MKPRYCSTSSGVATPRPFRRPRGCAREAVRGRGRPDPARPGLARGKSAQAELLDQLLSPIATRLGVGLPESDALADRAAAVGGITMSAAARAPARSGPLFGVELALGGHLLRLPRGIGGKRVVSRRRSAGNPREWSNARHAGAEDLPPLELFRPLQTLELEKPSSRRDPPPRCARAGRAPGGVCLRHRRTWLALAVFDAGSRPGRLVPALSELPTEHAARSKAKPDLEALTSLPPFEGHPHGALLELAGSTEDRDRAASPGRWERTAHSKGSRSKARPRSAVHAAAGNAPAPERRGRRRDG